MKLNVRDFAVTNLGPRLVNSPLDCPHWVTDDDGVLLTSELDKDILKDKFTFVEKAGPREKLFFDPKTCVIGIVTCGGLCPGLNDVIRSVVMTAWHRYGVRKILGFKYGYEGLNPKTSEVVELTPERVADIHYFGGTMLASSRGAQDVNVMVDYLMSLNVSVLFTIGGDGTQKGALAISNEVRRRGLHLACVGIPKTIDNDVNYVEKTFGFETAVQMAQPSIHAAHEEARGAKNGIGIVKLMGRDSGFIAMYASIASNDVNICLIPEVPFTIDQIVNYIAKRFQKRNHCLIVVAEGAGQANFSKTGEKDASGNVKYVDIGVALRDALGKGLKAKGIDTTIKYIDPSYTIRSAPCIAHDAIFCVQLAQMAVHAGLAGKTGIIVGMINSQFVHIPVERSVEKRKMVDVKGAVYQTLRDNTGMPYSWDQVDSA
eukprot:comp18679_c1_seq1/m.20370 comp18679_c1_seq1/g.20370  ORF comp18679_c1_seq1/g.20370 comp18679_c1_seq1/m.20370 type:complete len:430 (-) comp18679_c1_seq1:289-1578(-)